MDKEKQLPKWYQIIVGGESRIAKVVEVLATIMFFTVTSLLFIQVIGRYVLGIPTAWSEELARYIWMPTVFLGCAYVTHIDKHIEINLNHIYVSIPKTREGKVKLGKALDLFRFSAVMIIAGILSHLMIEYTLKIASLNKITPASHVPQWIFLAGMATGLVFITIESILHLMKTIVDYQFEYDISEEEKAAMDIETGGIS